MSWFHRHLNWTYIIATPISYVVAFLVVLGLYGANPSLSPDVAEGAVYLVALPVFLVVAGWILREKRRSLWWLLLQFVPFGGLSVFLLENRNPNRLGVTYGYAPSGPPVATATMTGSSAAMPLSREVVKVSSQHHVAFVKVLIAVCIVGIIAIVLGVALSGEPGSTPTSATAPPYEPGQSAQMSAGSQAGSKFVSDDASQMVLSIDDFKPGWVRTTAEPTTKEGALSAYHVYYYDGAGFPYPAVVQNTVAVYPSVEVAHETYLSETPQNVSLDNPRIGDESFLDISVPESKRLVFREANVVVRILLQQDMFGDPKPYARIVEERIPQ